MFVFNAYVICFRVAIIVSAIRLLSGFVKLNRYINSLTLPMLVNSHFALSVVSVEILFREISSLSLLVLRLSYELIGIFTLSC